LSLVNLSSLGSRTVSYLLACNNFSPMLRPLIHFRLASFRELAVGVLYAEARSA
jgi:hypothetical protein